MKTMKYLFIALFIGFSFASCGDDSSDELSGGAATGGLLNVNNALIGYVVGNGNSLPYSASVTTYKGQIKTTSVDVYKVFTNINGDVSNEVLLKTLTPANLGEAEDLDFTVTYDELISGLSVGGTAMSSNDGLLNIGDFWTLRYVSKTSDGKAHSNASTTKISVGTRFAGNYRCVNAAYYRIGVLTASTANWPSKTVIESVNATTYRVVEYFGYFPGNTFYFTIDSSDVIGYPDNRPDGTPQIGNSQPFVSCATNASLLTNVGCGPTTNIVVRDNVLGKDKLIMSFGYNTTSGAVGPREFYQEMEKIVD